MLRVSALAAHRNYPGRPLADFLNRVGLGDGVSDYRVDP